MVLYPDFGQLLQASAVERGSSPVTTGRTLVLLRQGAEALQAGVDLLASIAGLAPIRFMADDACKVANLPPSTAMILEHIGVAVVNADPNQVGRLSVQTLRADAILAVEAERVVQSAARLGPRLATRDFADLSVTPAYLCGYRDGFDHAVQLCLGGGVPEALDRDSERAARDEASEVWAMRACRVAETNYSGVGVRIAVLDAGVDSRSPDIAARRVIARSFAPDGQAHDEQAQRAHAAGVAASPKQASPAPRRDIAPESELFVGRILDDAGCGCDGDLLAGIDWAVGGGCRVVSMSLGAAPGSRPSIVFESVARRALAAGALLVASAGSRSARPRYVAPVDHPANCASIMAVAAVDSSLQIAPYSNGGTAACAGLVDIAAPGSSMHARSATPRRYDRMPSDCTAAQFVAEIAALHAQTNPGISAVDLWTRLLKTARPLGLPENDVGAGLVQAPVG